MWRDHTGGKGSTPHPISASNWADPKTYVWSEEVSVHQGWLGGLVYSCESFLLRGVRRGLRHGHVVLRCLSLQVLFPHAEGPLEDMFLYKDAGGRFHALFHLQVLKGRADKAPSSLSSSLSRHPTPPPPLPRVRVNSMAVESTTHAAAMHSL